MKFTREEHVSYLESELEAIYKQYLATVNTSAISLLEKDEVFSCQFVKFEEGELILKFKNERNLPRKGDYFNAVLLNGESASYKKWGNVSYLELVDKNQIAFSEAICIWHGKTGDPKYSIAGFRGITLELADKLVEKCIVILGPKAPPYKYMLNLIKVVKKSLNPLPSKILDFDLIENNWSPYKLDSTTNFTKFILNQISISNELIIQGPPGTGKTHKIAEIASELLALGTSVLVTALTNQALIELALKPSMISHLKLGNVHKTNLTTDEAKILPQLKSAKEIVCMPSNLCLSTFYVTSGLASEITDVPPFDFVIMDEASQALLAMFACTKLLGKNVIWIGDPYQLPPVTILNSDIIKTKGLIHLINGLQTVCNNLALPSFVLTETYRLTDRAATYTGIFYRGKLQSKSAQDIRLSFPELHFEIGKYFHTLGGPTLIKTTMPTGDSTPEFAIQLVVAILSQLMKVKEKKMEIAVLTKLKKTVKSLQKYVTNVLGNEKNILIETVERVQGLTCDICIFLIPNAMPIMSLDKNLFNVATSRASKHTIIIADKSILSYAYADKQVAEYLKKLNEDYSFEIEPNNLKMLTG